jgi:small nuclear ribonucleoprotein (snRNP)-like protein
MNEYTKKDKKVAILLSNGKTIIGNMNVVGYNRASDSIVANDTDWVMIYNASDQGIDGDEILINKSHIIYISLNEEGKI